MATFFLRIISHDKVFYKGQCNCLVIPDIDGERAIMAHHEQVIFAINFGEMRYQKEPGGEWVHAILGQGFCSVANNRVMLLADTVELPEEVDVNRAREELELAQEKLRQKQSIQEYHMTRAMMARALIRLKATEKFRI